MYRNILVPLDGSKFAEEVLPHAEAIAKMEGARITIVRVPDLTPLGYPGDGYYSALLEREEEEASAQIYIDRKVEALQKDDVEATGFTRKGPIRDAILGAAEETKADLIAMSTHGRKGFSRFLFGSIAEDVARNSNIPVMMFHPN